MKDELVTFKTAQLAKEKGYNNLTVSYSNPTQTAISRWLREEFKAYFWVEYYDKGNTYSAEIHGIPFNNLHFSTYEEAVEYAISYILTNLHYYKI